MNSAVNKPCCSAGGRNAATLALEQVRPCRMILPTSEWRKSFSIPLGLERYCDQRSRSLNAQPQHRNGRAAGKAIVAHRMELSVAPRSPGGRTQRSSWLFLDSGGGLRSAPSAGALLCPRLWSESAPKGSHSPHGPRNICQICNTEVERDAAKKQKAHLGHWCHPSQAIATLGATPPCGREEGLARAI